MKTLLTLLCTFALLGGGVYPTRMRQILRWMMRILL